MTYRWLLFDADGTLFDYEKAEALALQRTFDSLGLRFEPACRELYHRINHDLWLALEQGTVTAESLRTKRFELLFATLGLAVDVQSVSRTYLGHLANASELMPGALETITALRPRYHLALITNGLRDVQRPRLAQSALKDSFAAFIISEEVGAAKPSPAIFDIAFREMGHPARNQVLLIGDSLTSDIQGGINYRIDTCWFNPTRAPRPAGMTITYEIAHLNELARILF